MTCLGGSATTLCGMLGFIRLLPGVNSSAWPEIGRDGWPKPQATVVSAVRLGSRHNRELRSVPRPAFARQFGSRAARAAVGADDPKGPCRSPKGRICRPPRVAHHESRPATQAEATAFYARLGSGWELQTQ